MCQFVLVFFSHSSIAITSFGEERGNLSAFRTFVRFVLVWICRFPLPLGVWEELRFVIVALPGLFSYLFFAVLASGKGRGGMFLFLLFLHCHSFSFLPCPSLLSPLLPLLSLFSRSLGDETQWPTRVGVSLNPNTINQLIKFFGISSNMIKKIFTQMNRAR